MEDTWGILKIIGEVTGLVLLGAFGGMYLFSTALKSKRKEEDQAEDRLNSILKQTVDGLEKKVSDLQASDEQNKKEIKRLSTENEVITKIFQGKDGKSEELYQMAKSNTDSIAKLYTLMERHITIVEKALKITETAQHQS